jgi:hypothetical protein
MPRLANLAFAAVIVTFLFCGVARSSAAPRAIVHGGDFVRLLGTAVVCTIDAGPETVDCFRVDKTGKQFAPGGYSLRLQSDGQLLVNHRVGSVWRFVYGRVPAAASHVYLARPGDRFRVGGGPLGCNVGKAGLIPRPFVQCGFLDSTASLRLPGSVGFEFFADGSFDVVQFDAAGSPKIAFTNEDAARGRGLLRLSTSANITIAAGGNRQIACGGALSQGLKVMTCGLFANGQGARYSFALREDGLVVAFDSVTGTPKSIFDVPGNGKPAAGVSEAPTGGNVFSERPGGEFKLAGTPLTCLALSVGGKVSVRCGFGDAKGLGAPFPTAAEIDADGVVTVLTYNAQRRTRPIFTSPRP